MVVSSATKPLATAVRPKLETAELLFRSAQQMGLRPSWVTPGGLFAVTLNGQERYVNLAHSPLNSHTSISLAKNKYFTRLVLERHGITNIPFARPLSLAMAESFLRAHKKIVAKPLKGSGARDIHIVTSTQQLQELAITKYILEKYITGQELRYLVLNDTVIGVHRSDYGVSVQEDRALARISYPFTAWDPVLTDMAIRIAHILGLNFAAVDFLITPTGHAYVLEVNSTPGLKWFHAPTAGPVVDVARQFLEAAFELKEDSEEN